MMSKKPDEKFISKNICRFLYESRETSIIFYSRISDHPLNVIFITCEQYVNVYNKHFKKHCTDIPIRYIRLYYIYMNI